MEKPCDICGGRRTKPDERMCAPCKKTYLRDMREKHPDIPVPKIFSDERGRKNQRGAHTIGGEADMREADQD